MKRRRSCFDSAHFWVPFNLGAILLACGLVVAGEIAGAYFVFVPNFLCATLWMSDLR